MPAPGSKKAPLTFDGDEQQITEFMDVYERCIDDAQLPRSEWVTFLFRYLTRFQRDIFEAFDGVDPADWDIFKAAIHESFARAFKAKKYTLASLEQFVKQSSANPIQSDPAFRAYHRQFQAIMVYLIKEKELAAVEQDWQYWYGLHPRTRLAIEQRLAITLPDHPRAKPYSVADVYKAGCYVFDTNPFDLNLPQAIPTPPNESTVHDGRTDSREVRTVVPLPVAAGHQDDLSTLVRHLASLRVNDLDYATTYARLVVSYPQ